MKNPMNRIKRVDVFLYNGSYAVYKQKNTMKPRFFRLLRLSIPLKKSTSKATF
jgi:hypothetical protein